MPRTSKENLAKHKIWRAAVLDRDKYCQVCGWGEGDSRKRLNAHHLLPKEFKEWRWDVSNGMMLCVHHHTLGKLSAHKNPVWFSLWLEFNKPIIYYEICHRIKKFL